MPVQQTCVASAASPFTGTVVMLFALRVIRTHLSASGAERFHGADDEALSSTLSSQLCPLAMEVHGMPAVPVSPSVRSWQSSVSKYAFELSHGLTVSLPVGLRM